MPNCGCSKPCNCSFTANGAPIVIEEFDGFSSVFLDTGRIGWGDNVVDGTGSVNNPYMVSFKDSVEFRPKAQEWREVGNFSGGSIVWTTEPTLYSTPHPNSLFLWNSGFPADANLTSAGFMVGCYADINTGGVGAPIELGIFFQFFINDLGPDRIAYNVTTLSNPILSCSGFVNPARSALNVVSSGLRGAITVQVRDPSQSIVSVNEVRLWGMGI